MGKEVFQDNDGVLACGCGYGAELLFWKDKYKLHHITGIDTNEDAIENFRSGIMTKETIERYKVNG